MKLLIVGPTGNEILEYRGKFENITTWIELHARDGNNARLVGCYRDSVRPEHLVVTAICQYDNANYWITKTITYVYQNDRRVDFESFFVEIKESFRSLVDQNTFIGVPYSIVNFQFC